MDRRKFLAAAGALAAATALPATLPTAPAASGRVASFTGFTVEANLGLKPGDLISFSTSGTNPLGYWVCRVMRVTKNGYELKPEGQHSGGEDA